MQPLDKDTLFSIFEAGDEEVYKENNVSELLDNPYVLIGMVVRGVQNWHIMDIMYKRSHPKEYDRVRRKVMYKYFIKICGYLERLDINNFKTLYTIGDSYDIKEVKESFDQLLKYFEGIEYYEKCAIVKSYLDLLNHEYITKDLLKNTGIKLPN